MYYVDLPGKPDYIDYSRKIRANKELSGQTAYDAVSLPPQGKREEKGRSEQERTDPHARHAPRRWLPIPTKVLWFKGNSKKTWIRLRQKRALIPHRKLMA